jgi:hypothetical protein
MNYFRFVRAAKVIDASGANKIRSRSVSRLQKLSSFARWTAEGGCPHIAVL